MMARAATKQVATVDATASRDVVLAKYETMILAIPLAEDDDGFGLISAVITATTWDEMNSESKLPKAEAMAGKDLKVVDLHRRVSDLEGGMPWYLVVDYLDERTGEVKQFQTSAGVVMAKLVQLYTLGVLPALVRLSKAEKKTKAGFYPMNMEILAATPPGDKG